MATSTGVSHQKEGGEDSNIPVAAMRRGFCLVFNLAAIITSLTRGFSRLLRRFIFRHRPNEAPLYVEYSGRHTICLSLITCCLYPE